tara:strand:- start:1532 stop:1741 length:210 start_codon:yes stop_codon:yes gene_type:complete
MKKNVNEYRDEVMTHLEYIKEKVDKNYSHLERVNGRLNKAENDITAIKTTGITLSALIGIVLTWLGLQK